MKNKLLLFLLLPLFLTRPFEAVAQINTQDSLALVDLYNSTAGASWTNSANWLTSAPVSTWYGVTTNGSSVTKIKLASNNLVGTIPSSIGNLSNLVQLLMPGNQLTGSIPSSIGNLANLFSLTLSNNQLTGSIPSSLDTLENLEVIQLGQNQLSGSIPSGLDSLYNLSILDLAQNQLSDTIPSSLYNLAPIGGTLNLFSNQFVFNGMEGLQLAYDANKFDLKYDSQTVIQLNQTVNTFSVSAGGTLANNTYNWYKNGVLVYTVTGDSTYTATASGNYNVVVTNSIATELTLYSDTTASNIVVLPLKLLTFTATNEGKENILTWSTAQEINTSYFSVQTITSGNTYTDIATLQAAGNSSVQKDYSYTDLHPKEGVNYYRLKMADENGNFTYSNVATAKVDGSVNVLSVYPNPTVNTAYISFTTNYADNYTIEISDLSGKVIESKYGTSIVGTNKVNLDLSSFASGTYIVILTDKETGKTSIELDKL